MYSTILVPGVIYLAILLSPFDNQSLDTTVMVHQKAVVTVTLFASHCIVYITWYQYSASGWKIQQFTNAELTCPLSSTTSMSEAECERKE